jgi:phosphoribosylformylglycinamidine cyclo-ligase
MTERYLQRGVSASKEDVHRAIAKLDKGLFPKAFCKIVPDILAGDPDYCTIMHADGAGTKTSLAYLYWKETGDLSVWRGIAQDSIVMNTDDLICVGATGPMLISSSIDRNKNKIPGEVIAEIINGTEEVLEMLRNHGVEIYSTGGETADVGDLVRTITVNSTVIARMKRSDVISNDTIQAGDVIVGTGVVWAGFLRNHLQRWHGQQRPYLGAPRRVRLLPCHQNTPKVSTPKSTVPWFTVVQNA